MARLSSLFAALIAVSVVAAKPIVQIRESPVTLPFAVKLHFDNSGLNIADFERARFAKKIEAKLAQKEKRAVVGVGVSNDVVTYEASVGVGSPATQYNLLIDTGSSNTWVGAGRSYVKTSTSKSTKHGVSVSYGSGSFSGTEFTDTVTLAPGLVITAQSIGVASTSTGFDGVDGILGIGPVDLTEDTVANTNTVPTVTDNLFSRGIISANEIGISFNPTTSTSTKNGELTFGGTDSSKFTGSIAFSSTNTSPANEFWGVNESITYAGKTIMSNTAGIVDTGTTLLLLPTSSFNAYQSATGAVADSATGLLRVTSSQFAALQSLFFNIGGTTYEFTANAQIFPRALNTQIGGTAGNIYLITADFGTTIGSGLDFINGYVFLERFYSVFNTATHSVGFATTPNTHSTVN